MAHADVLARHAVVRTRRGHDPLDRARRGRRRARTACSHLTTLVRRARDRAREALAGTPEQLPVFKQAGVVDSGGTGLVAVVRRAVLTSSPATRCPIAPPRTRSIVHVAPRRPARRATSRTCATRSCTCSRPTTRRSRAFREVWSGIGDSIVIVGGDGPLQLPHPHRRHRRGDRGRRSTRAARATSASPTSPSRSSRSAGCARRAWSTRTSERSRRRRRRSSRSWWARASGGSSARSACATLVKGGQSMNPSTADLVEAVRATGSRAGRDPAEQQEHPPGRRAGRRPRRPGASRSCRPTRSSRASPRCSPTTPTPRLDENAEAMSALGAQRRRRRGDPGGARHRRPTSATVHVGDWIGLVGDGRAARSPTRSRARATSCSRSSSTPSTSSSTIIEGEGASPANTRRITEFIADEYPELAVEVHHGGQPLYPYYFGIE